MLRDDAVHKALDSLQIILGTQESARILVIPVESTLHKLPDEGKRRIQLSSHGKHFMSLLRNSRIDFNFILLVVLSTAVAAIGLVENNVTVVIGAMVIAPLLGPNLALGLGTALGDHPYSTGGDYFDTSGFEPIGVYPGCAIAARAKLIKSEFLIICGK